MFADYRPNDGGSPPPAGLVVRSASARDCQALARLEHARDATIDVDRAENRCRTEIDDRGVCLLVTVVGGEVCGFGRAAWFEPGRDAPANRVPTGWYLLGLIVGDRWRRQGIGTALTRARLAWIAERASEAFYFANTRNESSIDLHAALGFEELTRDFWVPHASFADGGGVLFRIALEDSSPSDPVGSAP